MSAATEIPIVYDNVPTILSRYASTALFLYDTLITLGDEIEYVWKAKWSTPKGLYLVVRYFGLATAIFSCGMCLALKVGYGVTYTIELALLCYYVSHHAPNRQTGGEDYGGNLGCVITSLTNNDKGPSVADIILAGSIAPVVIFNVILLFLVFYNILPAYRRNVGGEYTPLYTAILRDGGMYFVLVTASAIAVALTPLVWYNRPDRNNLDVP
ncbi:hypothetical protein CALVIDRAFT_568198 [Calocera viscosa TUFC12733]|uniref:DUF6533 domain-containing protein n=1 Tax=Calocera viscosa (strain TUFC12733) TaxID=1330018 RepID=A0A167HDH9_CALVF|nr:hypothetical protein CALVIDRAFT_568198 [Calocera viscosa TUFC12733]